ncbi:MAG: hypothetical protein C4584_00105 [Armatimonadetes bacterium]|nr:MAG: hypothetical protein C4584_00105 [Armatimonadota bacterium]
MPARHRIKQYLENSYYHIYNRGVEKRLIFLDEQDCSVFLSYLKDYLMPKNEVELLQKLSDPQTSYKERDKILKLLRLNNFADEITLLAYCLMPNHFHLFIKQKSAQSIDGFMRSLATRYTMYFNKKYKRVGNLCQDIYKAVLINTEEQFLYLSGYIHQQALASQGPTLQGYSGNQPSSYPEYLGERKTPWVHPEEILAFYSKTNLQLSYQAFVEKTKDFSPLQLTLIDD